MRERLAGLSRGQMVGLVVVVIAALAGAGLWYVRSLPQPVLITQSASDPGSEVPAADAPGGSGASIGQAPSPVPSPSLIVDVAGWVRHPGVYEFYADDRVIDAVERAGGARKGAEVTGLNLAAPLSDGQQILVPPPASRAERTEASSSATPDDEAGKINVNSASEAELETLNGIGEVLAAAIVDHREKNGPFENIEQLEEVSGIGPVTLEDIRADVTV